MTTAELLTLIWSRRRWFFAVTGGVLLLAVLIQWLYPPTYSASARVLIDNSRQRDSLVDLPNPAQLAPSYLITQLDVLRSRRVALRAVDLLGLRGSGVAQRIYEEAGRPGSFDEFFAERLIDRLTVIPSRDSNVIEIMMRAPDPRFAAAVANAFATAYVQTHLELKVQPAKDMAQWFEAQTRSARLAYEAAQQRLSDFQRSQAIVSSDERLDIETSRLQDLSSQLTHLQAVRAESAKKAAIAREAARTGLSNLPEVANNPVVSSLKADAARIQVRLAELQSRYGANFPEVRSAQDELLAVQQRLTAELKAVSDSLAPQADMNTGRERELSAALEQQRRKVLAIKRQRDQMAVLQREVDTTMRSFDALAARLQQTSIESDASSTNVMILDDARDPAKPSSPNPVLIGLTALALGPLLGALAAITIGMLDRRPLNEAELESLMQARVVATVPRIAALRKRLGHAVRRRPEGDARNDIAMPMTTRPDHA